MITINYNSNFNNRSINIDITPPSNLYLERVEYNARVYIGNELSKLINKLEYEMFVPKTLKMVYMQIDRVCQSAKNLFNIEYFIVEHHS